MNNREEIAKKKSRFSSEQLAELRQKLSGNHQETVDANEIPANPTVEDAPLSFSQQRFWFLEQIKPGLSAHHISVPIRYRAFLDPLTLSEAVRVVVRRHAMLRTRFTVSDGVPRQSVSEQIPDCSVEVVDLGSQAEQVQNNKMMHLMAEEANGPFNLLTGPLFRLRLARLDTDDHLLIITMHHIISDGWSLGIFMRELASTYRTLASGGFPNLPPLAIQYADYARWQQVQQANGDFAPHERYWKTRLSGAPAVLELPLDKPRPAEPTYVSASLSFTTPLESWKAFQKVCAGESASTYMGLLAAYVVTLYAYTGQEDMVIGSPAAGRNKSEIEDLIGLFVNTLALRADVSGKMTLRTLLNRCREICMEAFAHQDLPFDKLVESLHLRRDLNIAPVFQVLYVYQHASQAAVSAPLHGVADVHRTTGLGSTTHDLTLTVTASSDELTGFFEYPTDLLQPETIDRITQTYQAVINEFAVNPDVLIADLDLLSGTERQLVLFDWNETDAELPEQMSVADLFELQVAKTPNGKALVYQSTILTYQELEAAANRLAHRLQALGVGAEKLVCILLERTHLTAIAMLSTLKAGGAFVPLDVDLPPDRLKQLLIDINPSVVITRRHFLSLLPAEAEQVLLVDEDPNLKSKADCQPPVRAITPYNLAYVIYTSGSMGKPKGVLMHHRGLINQLIWRKNDIGINSDDCLLHTIPFSFDPSIWQLFGPLISGAAVVLAGSEQQHDMGSVWSLVDRFAITILDFVPSALCLFVEHPRLTAATTLRHIYCGGEALPKALGERCMALWPIELYNQYGPTEGAIDAAYYNCASGTSAAIFPIGRPIANTSIYVLNADMQPAPFGVLGEIYMGGVGLARGYHKAPGLTAEKFIPDSLSGMMGSRLYKTGDLGRFLSNGVLEFHGRTDRQVKLNGLRIELGEIEATARMFPDVTAAFATVRTGHGGANQLVMAVETKDGTDGRMIQCYLREKLPSYMVPMRIVPMSTFPRTASGKVDISQMPALDLDDGDLNDIPYVEPQTSIEKTLARLWAKLLRLPKVGILSDVFTIGAHSLLVVQFVSETNSLFGSRLTLRDVFEKPTVAEIAAILAEGGGITTEAQPKPRIRQALYPLSFQQKEVMNLSEGQGSTLGFVVEFYKKFDPHAFAECLRKLTERHVVLRSRLVSRQNTMGIEISDEPSCEVKWAVGEYRQAEDPDVLRIASQLAAQPIDLTKGSLRVNIVTLAGGRAYLSVSLNRLVADSWSLQILARDLTILYQSEISGQQPDLPPLSLQYPEYAVHQQEWAGTSEFAASRQFWSEQLEGLAPGVRTGDIQRFLPSNSSVSPEGLAPLRPKPFTYCAQLPPALSSELRQAAKEQSATIFSIMHAVLGLLIHRLCRSERFVIGVPVVNRDHSDHWNMIGRFVNMILVAVDCGGDPTLADLIKRSQRNSVSALSHSSFPHAELGSLFKPGIESDLDLIPVILNVHTAQDLQARGIEPDWRIVSVQETLPDKGLSLYVTDNENLFLEWIAGTSLPDRFDLEALHLSFVNILEQVASQLYVRVSTLTL